MADDSITLPKKGDKLFKSDSDWWHNACLNYWGVDLDTYAIGYKQAADILVRRVKEIRSKQDTLVYPIVFLYRQYIELRLKELILNGSRLLGSPKRLRKPDHEIDKYWLHCRKIFEKVWPEAPKDDLDDIEECIKEFSRVDPKSISFRYPKDKEGKPSIRGLSHINLRNLSEVIDRIASLLDGASTGISIYLDQKSEMESWYSE